jgi:tripartite ATP-independent transporter DctP family solute receptor
MPIRTARFVTAAAAAALLGAAAPAAPQAVLRLAHEDPPGGLRHQASQMFGEKLKAYTQGRYSVDVHHSGTLGNGPKLLEQMRIGSVDFATTGTAIYGSQVPELTLLTLPYLVETFEQGWALYDHSKWVAEWTAKTQAKGIRIVAIWEAGFRQVTAKKPVRLPEDVKGMKIRIAPNKVYQMLWTSLGANPTVLPFGEVYLALQQGVVDAQENPIPTIHASKFYEVAKIVSLTNHIYAPIPFSIAERRWRDMSAADRDAVAKAAKEVSAWHRKAVVGSESAMLEDMKSKGATIVRPDLPAFTSATVGVTEKASEQFPREIVQALLRDAAEAKARYPAK